jgi:hypothetical protein
MIARGLIFWQKQPGRISHVQKNQVVISNKLKTKLCPILPKTGKTIIQIQGQVT